MRFRLRDPAHLSKRGRPTGVLWATIIMSIGDAPPANMREWQFLCRTTSLVNTFTLPNDVQQGVRVWLTAYWMNSRGERGPATKPISIFAHFGDFVSQAA